jgi:hypothetical protein
VLRYIILRSSFRFPHCTALIVANNVKRVLADIDADDSDCRVECLRHGVLLVFDAPSRLQTLVGQEHGRTIPLTEVVPTGEQWLSRRKIFDVAKHILH